MARSLNKVQLIGNLTRDPELRYTPQGTAVVTFSVATNRQWKTESGEMKDAAEFHRVVAWDKLAEICGKMLKKGMRVYVEGRLQTRNWQGQDGSQKSTTEIVISDMLMLDSRREGGDVSVPEDFNQEPAEAKSAKPKAAKTEKKEEPVSAGTENQEVNEEDIPF
jgi:single-strand DNA-binding protein